jgi:iron complex outermembrane receptor protein
MNSTTSRLNSAGAKLSVLLSTASLLTIAGAISTQAQQIAQGQLVAQGQLQQSAQQTAQVGETAPEQVLVTGSLIRGSVAVGVPVTNLGTQDFVQTGALTTSELFRTVPAAFVQAAPSSTNNPSTLGGEGRINLRNLDNGQSLHSLLMIDGVRFPGQGTGEARLDPSIIPAISLDRVDVLVDGASATYGSDAITGVVNIILKRGYDGAMSQLLYTHGNGGGANYEASQLWGRTWDGGDITLSYDWYNTTPSAGASAHSKLTIDFTPWGLDNTTPVASAVPGIISVGAVTGGKLGTTCTNCFSIPRGAGVDFTSNLNGGLGPLTPSSAPGLLNWSILTGPAYSGTNGTLNEINPYSLTNYQNPSQRSGGAITVDQRLTKDISFYGDGFYNNRRAQGSLATTITNGKADLLAIRVPTSNPYYPTGSGVPNNLVVNVTSNAEFPALVSAAEVSSRYLGGLHIALPAGWNSDVYYSETYDSTLSTMTGLVIPNAVSAALGWTIAATAAQGLLPGTASWTKPANIPYLNLFCDPTVHYCNSPDTLSYINGKALATQYAHINEKGTKFDGPLFDVPAGTVKAAIGASYISYNTSATVNDTTVSSTVTAPTQFDAVSRTVWAVFAQVNIPIFGDANAIPLFRKLDLEASWRHDQYSDAGGTSNPKISANWTPVDGVILRGSWGTNFRAPQFGETSVLGGDQIFGYNTPLLSRNPITFNCNAQPGSLAYRAIHPVAGPAMACDVLALPGLETHGAASVAVNAGLRDYVNTQYKVLTPEKATDWALGAEFAPTNFLKGLDIQATWYSIKLTNVIARFNGSTSPIFNDPVNGFHSILPTDLISIDPACNNNLTPASCPEFQKMVAGVLADPNNPFPLSIATSINWLYDTGALNIGWQKLQGIDFTASYDIDLDDLGAWNVGIVGTYNLHNSAQTAPGTPIVDVYHSDLPPLGKGLSAVAQDGIETQPRLTYRARLGWSNGPWTATGFMNYISHYFTAEPVPPNVNGQCTTPDGTIGGGSSTCAIEGWTTNKTPIMTFDVSIGYSTGDLPVNSYLKDIGIQLVLNNILDKSAPFEYRPASESPGNPAAFDANSSDAGRTITLIVTKVW